MVNYKIGGLEFARLAVIDNRIGDDVVSIVPFDVTNQTESEAFRSAIEEQKGSVMKRS